MARMRITRAVNVRRYEGYEIDTDDLTPEQVRAIEAVGDYGVIEDSETLETIDEILDSTNPAWEDCEDSLAVHERNVDFMRQDNW